MKYSGGCRITLKKDVLDVQGKAVEQSIEDMGIAGFGKVRVGKYIELEINAKTKDEAMEKFQKIADGFLVNSVIEDCEFTIEELSA